MAEAISLGRKLNDMHGLAVTLGYAGRLAYYELGAVEMERLASDLLSYQRVTVLRFGWLLERFFAAGRAALRIAQKASHGLKRE